MWQLVGCASQHWQGPSFGVLIVMQTLNFGCCQFRQEDFDGGVQAEAVKRLVMQRASAAACIATLPPA